MGEPERERKGVRQSSATPAGGAAAGKLSEFGTPPSFVCGRLLPVILGSTALQRVAGHDQLWRHARGGGGECQVQMYMFEDEPLFPPPHLYRSCVGAIAPCGLSR